MKAIVFMIAIGLAACSPEAFEELGAVSGSALQTAELVPSGTGQYSQFTSSIAKGTNYLNVDDAACDGGATYNYATAVGARDAYIVNLGSVPVNALITGVTVTPCLSSHTGGPIGTSSAKVFYRFDGVEQELSTTYSVGGTTTPTNRAAATQFVRLLRNAGSTMQIGVTYVGGGQGLRVSRVAVRLNYVTAPELWAVGEHLSYPDPRSHDLIIDWAHQAVDDWGNLVAQYYVLKSTDNVNFAEIGVVIPTLPSENEFWYYDTVEPGVVLSDNYIRYYKVVANYYGGSWPATPSVSVQAISPPSNLQVVNCGGGCCFSWQDHSQREDGFWIMQYGIDPLTPTWWGMYDSVPANTTTYQVDSVPCAQHAGPAKRWSVQAWRTPDPHSMSDSSATNVVVY